MADSSKFIEKSARPPGQFSTPIRALRLPEKHTSRRENCFPQSYLHRQLGGCDLGDILRCRFLVSLDTA